MKKNRKFLKRNNKKKIKITLKFMAPLQLTSNALNT